MSSRELQRIREAILDHRYVLTEHAYEEMENDQLDVLDVESAILTGRLEQTLTRDPRGTRYVVVGEATDRETRNRSQGTVPIFAAEMTCPLENRLIRRENGTVPFGEGDRHIFRPSGVCRGNDESGRKMSQSPACERLRKRPSVLSPVLWNTTSCSWSPYTKSARARSCTTSLVNTVAAGCESDAFLARRFATKGALSSWKTFP